MICSRTKYLTRFRSTQKPHKYNIYTHTHYLISQIQHQPVMMRHRRVNNLYCLQLVKPFEHEITAHTDVCCSPFPIALISSARAFHQYRLTRIRESTMFPFAVRITFRPEQALQAPCSGTSARCSFAHIATPGIDNIRLPDRLPPFARYRTIDIAFISCAIVPPFQHTGSTLEVNNFLDNYHAFSLRLLSRVLHFSQETVAR